MTEESTTMIDGENNSDTIPVIPEQGAIYIYTNNDDAVVIRQGDANGMDGEHFVYVHRCHLPVLIEKLQTFVDRS